MNPGSGPDRTSSLGLGLCLFLVALLGACGGSRVDVAFAPQPTLASIAVTPGAATVGVGQVASFTATGTYSNGSKANITSQVTWTSANAGIASINGSTGVAHAVATGSTAVTAALRGVTSAPAKLTVTAAVVTAISISPAAASAPKGTTVAFSATGTYSDGTTGDISGSVTWLSSNPAVAMLNGSGIASALGQGSTTVTALANGVTSNGATLTVTPPLLAAIAINPANASVPLGLSTAFVATGTYSDGSTADVTGQVAWSSANPGIASINSASGMASGVAQGSTAIGAALSGITAPAANLTVTAAVVTGISITPASVSAPRGTTVTFTATGSYSDGSTGDISGLVSWVSARPTVVSVNAAGVATAREVDSGVPIAASLKGLTSNSAIMVVTPAVLASLSITPLSASIVAGGTQQFSASGTMTDGTAATLGTLSWNSSAPAVATLDANGLATGLAAGSTNISASSGGITSNSVVLLVN